MQINTSVSGLYASQSAKIPAATGTGSTSPSAAQSTTSSAATATETSDIQQVDFTNMTRQEMRDWVNSQIRSGEMSLDDSTAFVGMTLKVSAQTGQLVDSATDTTRTNFMENVRQGIQGAISRNNPDEAKGLQSALDVMQQSQGQVTGVDTYA